MYPTINGVGLEFNPTYPTTQLGVSLPPGDIYFAYKSSIG